MPAGPGPGGTEVTGGNGRPALYLSFNRRTSAASTRPASSLRLWDSPGSLAVAFTAALARSTSSRDR